MSTTATLHQTLPQGTVEGRYDPRFEPVVAAFLENFATRREVGASVALSVGGETLVDIWGGLAEPATKRPWRKDTVSIVFSCTKGATALCAHILSSQKALDLEAPVVSIWPEFAKAGKEQATLRMMLDHSVGVPVLREPAKPDCLMDWNYMTDRLAAQAPYWQPGTRNGYHAMTFGFTVGEIIRRVAGQSLGSFFQEQVAGPLGLDFWIGLPEAIEPRVAPMIQNRALSPAEPTLFFETLISDPNSIPARMVLNSGTWLAAELNTRRGRAAEIGSASGITNASGLKGMYEPLANGGGGLVDGDTLSRMEEVAVATHMDATLLFPTRFSLGFMKSMDNRKRRPGGDSVLLGRRAFGHVGAGGSIGFADPECGLSFGYTMNRMGGGIMLNERGQSLIDAAYRCLGYRSSASGVWAK
jgi:CubicO group peptidase (beta-lactamase class C family)